jgi:hypothetical protein
MRSGTETAASTHNRKLLVLPHLAMHCYVPVGSRAGTTNPLGTSVTVRSGESSSHIAFQFPCPCLHSSLSRRRSCAGVHHKVQVEGVAAVHTLPIRYIVDDVGSTYAFWRAYGRRRRLCNRTETGAHLSCWLTCFALLAKQFW